MISYTSFLLLFVTCGLLFVTCGGFSSIDVWALTTFKEAIYEDPLLVLSNWNPLDADPCDWSGISCSVVRDHVIKINISGSSLRGFLAPELGQITLLQELILHGNNLIGIIPKELGMLKNLKALDLGANQLMGPIPPELGNLTNIRKINLQSNGLTGSLPAELGNLKYLEELQLDRNRLQGTVPASSNSDILSNISGMSASSANLTGFCRTSQLKVADFSYNFFVGGIPKCLEYLPRSSFQGNCLENQDTKQRPTSQCGGSSPGRSHQELNPKHQPPNELSKHQRASRPAWLLALEIVTGTMGGSVFLIAVLSALQRWNSRSSIIIPWKKSASEKEHMAIYVDSQMLKDVSSFSRQELEVACEDFSNIIGSSPDSLVYKGTMKGGPEIAVISLCVKEEHWTGYLELYFQREIQVADLSRLNHENTGKLLGYCRESSPFTRMLVFEYASNGTLYEHLHYGEECQLSWTRRMKIIIGIARGLKYLHTELNPPFTISELNSSAVYLTEDFSPKLVDFESWKTILARSEKNPGSIGNQGDICLLPNSLEDRHLDVQGNVYAFGVLLLEIISGRPQYCKDKGCLVDWAKSYLDLPEVMSYVVDPELKHFRYDDLQVICDVVTLCIHPDPIKRPSMQELSATLESKIETSISAELKASSLAWAELALSS
ncbi:LRR_1 domain-containing protein/Pkinase_Tyr domain-containing protein/LRRNT_2 domain-containing protein [Cephalotus follicularis]|uniref:LRR_1 domain-containing protein/Pkinase_Tyr domain-containing protein/LRRNT_2 domain-containing protein n=1 Tax=Cephalotus follicularis TaxID=3775 RepID=A0A1Q3AQL1_CEPFO|nr:LRR_1 domain-containing protein/Pkinase_Tyr domain-containing protein/LRRNT_2 domain-containing protein [Cephalotus follicularis]